MYGIGRNESLDWNCVHWRTNFYTINAEFAKSSYGARDQFFFQKQYMPGQPYTLFSHIILLSETLCDDHILLQKFS